MNDREQMEYECTCGRRFEAEYEKLEDYYFNYDRGQYTTVWLETCSNCGRKYIMVDE